MSSGKNCRHGTQIAADADRKRAAVGLAVEPHHQPEAQIADADPVAGGRARRRYAALVTRTTGSDAVSITRSKTSRRDRRGRQLMGDDRVSWLKPPSG